MLLRSAEPRDRSWALGRGDRAEDLPAGACESPPCNQPITGAAPKQVSRLRRGLAYNVARFWAQLKREANFSGKPGAGCSYK